MRLIKQFPLDEPSTVRMDLVIGKIGKLLGPIFDHSSLREDRENKLARAIEVFMYVTIGVEQSIVKDPDTLTIAESMRVDYASYTEQTQKDLLPLLTHAVKRGVSQESIFGYCVEAFLERLLVAYPSYTSIFMENLSGGTQPKGANSLIQNAVRLIGIEQEKEMLNFVNSSFASTLNDYGVNPIANMRKFDLANSTILFYSTPNKQHYGRLVVMQSTDSSVKKQLRDEMNLIMNTQNITSSDGFPVIQGQSSGHKVMLFMGDAKQPSRYTLRIEGTI